MIYLDTETVPDHDAIASDAWQRYKQKHGVTDNAAALHPAFGRVACIVAWLDTGDHWLVKGGPDERAILEAFAGFAVHSGTFCGHNLKDFDLPFLACRYLARGMPLPQQLIVAGKKPWEIQHIDTMELLRFGGGKRISLDAACLMLGVPSPKEGRVKSDAVWPAYLAGDHEGIANLCVGDVQALIQVHRNIVSAERPAARPGRPAA